MKKYLILVFALLLIIVPFNTRAEEDGNVLYESNGLLDDGYTLDDYYEDYYDDDEEDDDYYYYDDSYVMEADDTLDLDATTIGTCEEKKLFTSNNIIFLAVGVVTGAALTIVAVVCTRGRCTCNCECCSKEEKEEKKTKTKKSGK